MKFQNIYWRDMVAVLVLCMCFYLILQGYNGFIQGIMAVIVGYYFSKRVFEEKNG